jgi:hypothetical protein
LWAGVSGRALLIARSHRELTAGGALALDAQTAPVGADVTATFYPQGLIRATGTTPEAFMALAKMQLAAAAAQDVQHHEPSARGRARKASTALQAAMIGVGDLLVKMVPETRALRVALQVTARDGLIVRGEIDPLPGSRLAKLVATASPYALDPALPIRDDRTGAAAWGSLGAIDHMVRALFSGESRSARRAREAWTAFAGTFTGGASCTFELAESPPSSACLWAIKPGVPSARALASYGAMMDAYGEWEGEVTGESRSVRVRRRGDALEIERKLTSTMQTPEQARLARSFFGGDTMSYAVGVRDGKLVQVQAARPAPRLASWRPAGKQAIPPALATTLARTRGYDAVIQVDPISFMMKAIEQGQDPRTKQAALMWHAVPGLAALRAPVVFAAASGTTASYELQLPLASLQNVATVVKPFMGMMGAAAAPPPAAPKR